MRYGGTMCGFTWANIPPRCECVYACLRRRNLQKLSKVNKVLVAFFRDCFPDGVAVGVALEREGTGVHKGITSTAFTHIPSSTNTHTEHTEQTYPSVYFTGHCFRFARSRNADVSPRITRISFLTYHISLSSSIS